MSQTLPDNPDLQYLKKEAKELLRSGQFQKLADAQHQLARNYGFSSWAKLKLHVEAQRQTPAEAFKAAVNDSDAARVRQLLEQHPALRATINQPLSDEESGAHALFAAVQRSDRDTIDVLLAAGADIRKRTECWAGGFGVLDDCDPSLVDFLRERGAQLDAHAAARLGRLPELRELIAANPQQVHARGGNGQTPLHFASTIAVAEFLLSNGASLDARDINHESTPAQHMLRADQKRHYPRDRQDVARYLIAKGCQTDLLMASALGDLPLVRRLLDSDPSCIRMTVSEQWFPKHDPRASGTIYFSSLGSGRTAHAVARDFEHEDVFNLLIERTPDDLKMSLAFELGDEGVFHQFLAAHPDAVRSLSAADLRKLPDAAQSNNAPAVRLLLEAGWPVDTPGEMGATALHWAAFNGNAALTREILQFHPQLELKSQEYAGPALAWAIYASGNGWRSDTGDFVGTVQALLKAGAIVPPHAEDLEPSDAVLEVLP